MAVLKIRDLKRHYGKVTAVDGVDLETQEGEMLAILGPSGSGKTTLMRMLAGLEQPSAGDITLDGRSVVGIPPRKRNVAMVFQSYALYPHMSVHENILFPLKSHKVPRAHWAEKVDWAVDTLGIRHLLERRPDRLSGGEKQRVALARALVRDPELFLFDEPLSALDAQVRNIARAELRDLHARTRITTLYVTHDQVEALGLGDRIAVMNGGRVRQLGTPEALYFDPADLFVASFIGNPPMNLLHRGETVLGIRAEHFVPREQAREPQTALTFRIRIDQLEFLGSEWLAYGFDEAGNDESRLVVRLPQSRGDQVRAGQVHEFLVARQHVKAFDAHTGQRRADTGLAETAHG